MKDKIINVKRRATGFLTETMILMEEGVSVPVRQALEHERSVRPPVSLETAIEKFGDDLLTPPELSMLYARLFSPRFSNRFDYGLRREWSFSERDTLSYGPPYCTNWCIGKKNGAFVMAKIDKCEGGVVIPRLKDSVIVPDKLLKRNSDKDQPNREYAEGEILYWRQLDNGFAFPVIRAMPSHKWDAFTEDKGLGITALALELIHEGKFYMINFGGSEYFIANRSENKDCFLSTIDYEKRQTYGALCHSNNKFDPPLRLEKLNPFQELVRKIW